MNFQKFLWIILLCAPVFWSCNEKVFTGDVDCNDCFIEQPENADLVINISMSSRFPGVRLTVYEGDVEDNDVVLVDTVFETPYYAFVPVDRKYSVKAEYVREDKVITAVDGTHLKVLVVTNACDERCYVIENEKLDVRLRKEFQ